MNLMCSDGDDDDDVDDGSDGDDGDDNVFGRGLDRLCVVFLHGLILTTVPHE